jgi:diguanylate cyclase (GGDEF)-like protein
MSGGETATRERLAASISMLWEKFRGVAMDRVQVLEDAVLTLLDGDLPADSRRTAEREAHKLAGAVGTFGFTDASRLAREAELMLAGNRPLEGWQVLQLSEIAVALRRDLARPAPAAGPAAEEGEGGEDVDDGARPLLVVVSRDAELAGRVAMEAEGRGLDTQVAADPPASLPASGERVILLDLAGRTPDDGLSALHEVAGGSAPVVVLSHGGSFADRLGVARRGASAFLQRPVSPGAVVDAVLGLLRPPDAPERHVLAVDDDPTVLAALRATLEPRGVRVTTLEDPLAFWDALERTRPDLLVMDVDMPGVSGTELCRVVRNEARWNALPIVVLTARVDSDSIQRVFAAGADDYVPKPFVGPELVARIEGRLDRVRLQRLFAETDPLTGVANRGSSEATFARLLRLSARHRQPLAVTLVDVDGLHAVNDRRGHAAGDEALRRLGRLLGGALRGEDAVGRWGGEEFVVAMYGTDRDDAVRRMEAVLERFRAIEIASPAGPFHATFSAGVAEAPADGVELDVLLRAADAALAQAREAGRSRVLPAGWMPGRAPRPGTDVVVVEDDEALAGLLVHTLETRGYRTRWIGDGEEAVAALCGADPELRPRVILLDVDLPGLDGMGVLRALAHDRVLDRSRVIMLTVRAGEGEVLKALEVGAFDHVAKPFSVAILLQRIGRALREG